MDIQIDIRPVGVVRADKGRFRIELKDKYIPALTNIDGFSHLQILWWGHLLASAEQNDMLVGNKPYKTGPQEIGVFATR